MRIGFFVDSYLPNTFGIEVSIESFRKNLEKLGHQVFIFAPYFANYKDTNPRIFRFRSLKICEKPEMRVALPFLSDNIEQFKKVQELKLDIVHSHSPYTMGYLGKYAADKQGIPFVYTHHTQYSEYAKVYFKDKLILPRLAKMWSKLFANWADLVIAPSPKIEKMLREDGVEKRIAVLPTGIDLSIFKKSNKKRKEIREKLGIAPQTKVLFFAGRISEEKNVAFLIDALKETLKKRKDVRLLLAGLGPKPYLRKLIKKAEENKVRAFVRFLGLLPRKDMPSFYQAADIFVFPSLTETQGIVVLEADASGLPVVVLEDDAFKNIVVNNKNGFLIKNNSPSSFSAKILKILEDKDFYDKLSLGSRLIASRFSIEKQTEKLLNLYSSVLKQISTINL